MSDGCYSYDEVPYASHPYAQTHPARLATIGTLFGMDPPDVAHCRVLELGCAAGGNLLPLAASLPDSRFAGIDLSAREIADGMRVVEATGMANVTLTQQDILEVDETLGTFDYILCHGVYSWVPDPVKLKILDICARQLSPQGLAYVSYNTFPGWHLRGTVREMMEFHARRFQMPSERVKHARALLDFLVKSVPVENNPYGLLLKDELDLLSNKSDAYIYHEHLERFNEPCYFYQFAELASAKGLRYVGEADYGSMSLGRFPKNVANVLRHLAADFEEMEQYMDFVRNRMFRQTLLCHAEVPLDRALDPNRITSLYVSGNVKLSGSPADSPTRFTGHHGSIATNDPLLKVALIVLGENWPEPIRMDELTGTVWARVNGDAVVDSASHHRDIGRLCAAIVECYAKHFIELSVAPPRFATRIGSNPHATALARHQANVGRIATNLQHQIVPLNDLERRVLALLDGRHDQAGLLGELQAQVDSGSLVVQVEGGPARDTAAALPILAESLDRALKKLAFDALLVRDALDLR